MRLFFFSLIFLSNIHLYSQMTISGRIVDADSGEGLLGAHIYLLNDWKKGTTSGLEGRFNIEIPDENRGDSIVISYVGFEEKLLPISSEMHIELAELQTLGETVTVTARPLIAEEFQYMELNKMEIYTNPAAKADPILAVNSLPFATTTDESANISLRGSSPVETGIFLNNVPIYDAVRYSQLNGIGTFSIFNTAIIESMTVFPGNPPLEFGNVTSGAISMSTDQRVLEENANSATLSLANIGFSREQHLNENQSLKLFTNWQPSNGIKKLNSRSLEDIKSFNSNDLGLYWFGSNEKINWKVLSYSNTERYQFNFRHPSFSGVFDQEKIRTFLTASIHIPVGKGEMSLNSGGSQSRGEYGYSSALFDVDKEDLFIGLNYRIDQSKFSIKTGFSYDQRQAEVVGNFHKFDHALAVNHPTVRVDESLKLKTLESFAYLKYYLSDDLAIGSGVRKNIPTDSLNYWSRQLNLSYRKERWSVTAGIGKYHKKGLFENSGESFHSISDQASLDLNYGGKKLLTTLSIFDKKGNLNGVTYHVKGLEIFADYRLSDRLSTSGSITWLDAGSDQDVPFQYDINYYVRANLAYKPGKYWTIESILNARQGSTYTAVLSAAFDKDLQVYKPLYSEEGMRLPDYWNVGLSISKIFLVSEVFNLIAFASVNNAFDHDNVRGYEYSADYAVREENLFSQRTGYLGVIVNF